MEIFRILGSVFNNIIVGLSTSCITFIIGITILIAMDKIPFEEVYNDIKNFFEKDKRYRR